MQSIGLPSTRREFILLSLAMGCASLWSPLSLAENLKKLELHNGEYKGPLLAKIEALIGRLDRKEISAEHFIHELSKRYDEFDLNAEFRIWLNETVGVSGVKDVFKKIDERHNRFISLFFIEPNSSHPPHAHHDLLSAQCVLKGTASLRQYDRISRVDAQHLILKLTNDTKLSSGGKILMTETKDNAHWFGAEQEPVIVFNFNLSGTSERTFDPPGSRHRARYYLDPTIPKKDDKIIAREITKEEAHERFEKRPLSFFKA